MKVRPRLLVISLVVAALASVAIGWAIARTGNTSGNDNGNDNGDTVIIDGTDGPLQPPSIETNAVVKGNPLPDVAVQTLDGTDVPLLSLVGAAHLTYGDRVRFVGIDYLPPSAREEAFARDRGVQYELLYDGNGVFISTVGIAAFPVTLFVNSDGIIVRQTGLLDEAAITEHIESDLL